MKTLPFAKPQKRKKLPKIGSLKKKAWHWFSLWVRRRSADANGIIDCITCKARVHWKEANASHFIHGHSKPIFMDERNVHASCVRCNLYLSGNLIEYAAFMKSKYGWETVDVLRELSHLVIKFDRDYYEGIITKYKSLVEGLEGA